MAKPLEEHLADYLTGLVRGPWTKDYNRRCLAMWREAYGDQLVARVEKLIKERRLK